MRTRTRTITTAAVLLLALTACSSDSDDKPSSQKTTRDKAAPSSATTPSPTPEQPRQFGQVLNFSDPVDHGELDVTVLGYEQGVKAQTTADQEFGTTGYVWAALEIKACVKKGTAGITRYPWTLAYADGARVEPSSVTYGDFPKPEYPYEATVKTGDCVRGKTVFPVPGDQRPERVLYTPEALPEPAEWAVPAA
ncbi:hypothetical protein ACIQ8D_23995 [Streptomyces sp. NPDC096094]|uniref:hypothetical protein n=1 Tax=Streptomyces sp. NPDC096094 TaxID=3366073 RepID=UPI00380360DE